jgi:hypothetical protein
MQPRSNGYLEGKARLSHFIAANDQRVVKVVTPTGMTGYVAASIPRSALWVLKQKLDANLEARHTARLSKRAPRSVAVQRDFTVGVPRTS